MILADQCKIRANGGLESETRKPGPRAVTLLSKEAWSDVCEELSVELVWQTRRANLLVEGLDLRAVLGKRLRIGEVCLLIHGESKPCKLMEQQHEGLREAMKPYVRGGVFGEVLESGTIHIGDTIVAD